MEVDERRGPSLVPWLAIAAQEPHHRTRRRMWPSVGTVTGQGELPDAAGRTWS